MSTNKSEGYQVCIGKGKNPKEAFENCIEVFDDFSQLIKEEEIVFIKCNLRLPNGFPTNTNFDLIKYVVDVCKKAGAGKILVGDYPYDGVSIQKMVVLLAISSFFEKIGAQLAFLDNSQYFRNHDLELEELKRIKQKEFEEIEKEGQKYLFPRSILEADKLILLNQVNVSPLFKVRYAIESAFSMVSNAQRTIINPREITPEYLEEDEYKKKLISKIIDIYEIKPADLVINDCFHLLEGAGPYIYEKSQIKKTNLMIASENALAADITLQHLFDLEMLENPLIDECIEKKLGPSDISDISFGGDITNLENNKMNIDLPITRMELMHLRNFSIREGLLCSGCKKAVYHFLNLMESSMIKDLKYIGKNSLLFGHNPPELDEKYINNIILFGDCAIKSTKNAEFRIIRTEKEKTGIGELLKGKFKENYTPKTTIQEKIKENKNIIEISGCPPDHLEAIQKLIDYFGKKDVPTLAIFQSMFDSFIRDEDKEKLQEWEEL